MPNPLPTSDKKEQTVQRMFSSIARYYDLNNTVLSLGLHHRWKKKTVELAGLGPGDRVADVGAGTADLAILAADRVGDRGGVVAIDLNEAMLQQGRAKLMGRDGVMMVRGNAERLPLKDQSVDAVLSGFCLRNVTDFDGALADIFRVLKPKGRMVCLEFSRPQHPILRKLYDFYSFRILPAVGQWVSSDRTGVYDYLPASIRQFPDQETFAEKLRRIGFTEVTYCNQAGGIVAIHSGKK
jgi:demethylmenaquinone methyltransferase/2-methoxy-6-polyprenyl-1,4-benzoquinol methylase